jgi:hypothetical protein
VDALSSSSLTERDGGQVLPSNPVIPAGRRSSRVPTDMLLLTPYALRPVRAHEPLARGHPPTPPARPENEPCPTRIRPQRSSDTVGRVPYKRAHAISGTSPMARDLRARRMRSSLPFVVARLTRRAIPHAFAVAFGSLALGACSGGGGSDPYSGPRSGCSNGPAYDRGTAFPPLDPNAEARGLPECVARCEAPGKASYAPYGTVHSVAALPSGSCAYDGEACSMGAVRTLDCPDGTTVACSLTSYACRCEGGTWRCSSGPPGASACTCQLPPPPLDAGPDAAD